VLSSREFLTWFSSEWSFKTEGFAHEQSYR
jgi:hypothetical protein